MMATFRRRFLSGARSRVKRQHVLLSPGPCHVGDKSSIVEYTCVWIVTSSLGLSPTNHLMWQGMTRSRLSRKSRMQRACSRL